MKTYQEWWKEYSVRYKDCKDSMIMAEIQQATEDSYKAALEWMLKRLEDFDVMDVTIDIMEELEE